MVKHVHRQAALDLKKQYLDSLSMTTKPLVKKPVRCNASNYKGRGRTESRRMDYDLSHLISSALKYKSLRRTVNFVQRPSDNFLADEWGFRGEDKKTKIY